MVDSEQRFITIQKNYTQVSVAEHLKNTISIAVYPNPASLMVNFKTESKDVNTIQVTDVVGRIVDVQSFSSSFLSLNTQSYNAGVYFYTVLDKNKNSLKTGKFIIEK